jgi:hypothetical protein
MADHIVSSHARLLFKAPLPKLSLKRHHPNISRSRIFRGARCIEIKGHIQT